MSRMNAIRTLAKTGALPGAIAGATVGGAIGATEGRGFGEKLFGGMKGALYGGVAGALAGTAKNITGSAKLHNASKRMMDMSPRTVGSSARFNKLRPSGIKAAMTGIGAGVVAGGYSTLKSNKASNTLQHSTLDQRLSYEKRKAEIRAQSQMKVLRAYRK